MDIPKGNNIIESYFKDLVACGLKKKIIYVHEKDMSGRNESRVSGLQIREVGHGKPWKLNF